MTSPPTCPRLAIDTCARRLRALDGIAEHVPRDRSISWFGPAGVPPDEPGSEAVIEALTGLMEVNGRDAGRPRRFGIEVASVAAGLFAAQGALAAAIATLRHHPVSSVRTSVLQAGLLLLSNYFVVATALGDAVPGTPFAGPGPPFRSADGMWFEIATFDAEAWKGFWTGLGVGDADLGRAWTTFQWRYERATCSLPPALHEATARRPLAELREAAARAGISLAPLRDYTAVLGDLEGAAFPAVRQVSPRGAPPGPREPSPPPRRQAGDLPLAGMRVVEATSRIQGPFAGMLLRMLGAEVVRVQPPEGDYGRAALCLHRGKEQVTVDLSRATGRAELAELVAGADVFLQNWRPGKAAQWGLEAEDLVRHRPGLVYAHTSGWGDRPEGRRLTGVDFLVQAHSGLGQALHPDGEPPFPSRVVLCDLFGGLVGAEGVLTALYRRERTGGSWEVHSSLLAGAMALQAHVLEDIAEGAEVGRRCGRPVWGPLDRPIPTEDGTLVVTADDADRTARLYRACGVDPAGAPRAALEERVAQRLAAGRAADWARLLPRLGVPAAVVADDVAAVPADPRWSDLFEPVGAAGMAPRAPWSFE